MKKKCENLTIAILRCGLKGWMWDVIKLSYFRGECCGIDVCLRLIAATNFKKIWVPWVKAFNPKWDEREQKYWLVRNKFHLTKIAFGEHIVLLSLFLYCVSLVLVVLAFAQLDSNAFFIVVASSSFSLARLYSCFLQ